MTARLRAGGLVAALSITLPLVLLPTSASAAVPGAEIAYVLDTDNDGAGAIVVRDLGTRTVRTVLPEGDDYVADPVLSPDGRSIAFSTDRGSRTFDTGIAVVGVDGSGFRRLTNPPASTDTSYTEDISPTWQPLDGTVVFSRVTTDDLSGESRGTLLSVAPAAGATPVALEGTGNAITPDISRDGRNLTYVDLTASRDDGASGEVVVLRGYRDSGSTPLVIALDGGDPAFSPDGREVAYTGYRNGLPVLVARRSADSPASDGGGPLLYGTRGSSALVLAPFWLPDGRSVAFSRLDLTEEGTSFDLWAADRSGLRNGPFLAGPADEVFGSSRSEALQGVVSRTPSTYVPVSPVRVLDTRPGTATGVGAPGRIGAGGTVEVKVAGQATSTGTVPAGVTAVVLNVTVTGVTAGTDVRAYPSGTLPPEVSSINATRGQTVPNLVTVPVGADGSVLLRNGAGEVHLIADLAGYYVPGDGGEGFRPLDPRRILDTRPGATVGVARAGRVPAGGVVPLKVTGELPVGGGGTMSVPATATAVILNVTGTAPSRSTDVRAYPHGSSSVPEVSNLNLTAGLTAPNLVIVRVGEDGTVDLRNSAGEVHLIADLAGYFGADGTARLVPAGPARFLDTRDGTGAAPLPVGAEGLVDVAVAGARGVAADAVAAVLNVTATGPSAGTDVRAFPSLTSVPLVSNLNVARGVTRANGVVVKTGSNGEVRLRNAAGSVQLIADLAGYFVPVR